MSDIKRAVLTSLEPQKVSEKASKKRSKTVRIRVPLPESNEDKCPEYNYKDELAAVKKKLKQNGKEVNNVPNGLDPFGDDNDDDVRRIALEMEAKYGSGMNVGARKKRKLRKDDYADIGAGYDESDSFIDNTDGYDEIIPPNVTTARGGFYINSGILDFKVDEEAVVSEGGSSSSSGEESEIDESGVNVTKRKRVLDSSSGEEGEGNSNHSSQGQLDKKPKSDQPNISMQQAIKKKLFSVDKIQIKKRKLASQHKNTVKELLRGKRTDTNSADILKDVPKENKKPMRLSSVVAAIDSVIARVEEPQKSPEKIESKIEAQIEELHQRPSMDLNIKSIEQRGVSTELEAATISEVNPKVEFVKLPDNLPPDIVGLIENLKRAAREFKDDGKLKFFSGDVNVMLLSLERKCKVLSRSSKVRVYEHLAPYVRCRRDALVKRAKNLVFEEEQRRLRKAIRSLKGQIDQLMPALITNYEKECQRVLQKKFSQEAATNEELKNLKAPRRRFSLHEEMKRMLRDIVSYKKRCLLHEGKPRESLEDLLTEYLKRDILTLWPEGWMSMTVLKKFCTTSAIKTPDPKALSSSETMTKHSQKSSAVINYGAGNNLLTITPVVNLVDKLSSQETTTTIVKSTSSSVVKQSEETVHKEKSDTNGVIVLNSKTTSTNKEDAAAAAAAATVIPPNKNCQTIIDLTNNTAAGVIKEQAPSSSTNFEASMTLKTKFPCLSVTANAHHHHHPHNDRDDVQKVMDSLKALQKLSSPSKNPPDISNNPGVSVIAFNNKAYSNNSTPTTTMTTNSSQGGISGAAVNSTNSSDRTNFSGLGFHQDDYQKQFVNSFSSSGGNNKSPPSAAPPPKPPAGFSKCS